MILPNPIESLSDTYAARDFIALYRISPDELAALASPFIDHHEPISPEEDDRRARECVEAFKPFGDLDKRRDALDAAENADGYSTDDDAYMTDR